MTQIGTCLSIFYVTLLVYVKSNPVVEIKLNNEESRVNFVPICQRAVGNSKIFTNSCDLIRDNFSPKLNTTLEFIVNYNNDENLNTLLGSLFEDSTIYFAEKNPQYVAALTDFLGKLNLIRDQLKTPNGLTEVKMSDLYSTFTASGLEAAVVALISYHQGILYSYSFGSEEYINYDKEYFCVSDGNFCGKSIELFLLRETNNYNTISLYNFLLNSNQNAFNYFISSNNAPISTIFAGKEQFDRFVQELNAKGTLEMTVRSFADIIRSNRLFQSVVDYYDPISQFISRTVGTTTTTEPGNTTETVALTKRIAIDSDIVLTIPLALVGAGSLLSIIIIAVVYKCRAQETHFPKTKPAESEEIPMEKKITTRKF